MTRPSLVVGLGGTGQWVLTWLKRDLLLSNNNKMPDNVRLLSLDTSTQLEAGAKRINSTGEEEEGVEVGGVSLAAEEFVYLGGDSKPLADRVRDGRLPNIGQWYHAQRWLDSQPPAAFILDDGAGRIRQFGRMAIFKDILGKTTGSQLWRSCRTAIETVRGSISEQRRLEIIVVGSFAGGTGSGMFLDVSLILRLLAQKYNVPHLLRGFFALPSVFTNAPNREMLARTFAAWRELNRFMVINSDFPMPLIEYIERDQDFRIQPDQRIFDACYLVDGRRSGQPLSEDAQHGVFPMIADVLSAILDENAGTRYTQWVTTNLASAYAERPEMPMYSAIGAYSIQVPASFVQQASSYTLGQDMLKSLLTPTIQPDEYERFVAQGADRHLALAAPNRNLEDRGFSGRQRSPNFFSSTISYQGRSVSPSVFLGRVGELIDGMNSAGQSQQIINQLAGGKHRWANYFTKLGDDPEFEDIQRRVKEYMDFNVRRAFGRGADGTAEDFEVNIKKLPTIVREKFGGITSTGEELEEFYGESGDALKRVQEAHVNTMRRQLRVKTLELLMGQSDNAVDARSGKLGYAWDYFDGLANLFGEFLNTLDQVRKRREELKPSIKLEGLSDKAQRLLDSNRGRKLFWLMEHPNVKGSEEAYLQAQQRMVDLRREDILHTFVSDTVAAFKALVEQVRDTIKRWILHLATGDDASGMPGLWDNLRQGKQELHNAHSYDTRTAKVQRLLGQDVLKVDNSDLAQSLSRWQWNGQFTEQGFDLNVKIMPEVAGDKELSLTDPTYESSTELRRDLGNKNARRLLSLAARPFEGVVARTTIAQAIKETFGDQPRRLAEEVANVSAEPLFHGDPVASPRKKSNFIRIKATDDPYFRGSAGLEGELRVLNSLERNKLDDDYGIQVVGSENPYKLTLVRTDDLYDYNHYESWHECVKAYEHLVYNDEGVLLDPVLLQNFPAEARAVEYERILAQDENYRPLHPRVVMLLEDPIALRQFLYLGMLGMVTTKDDKRTFRWELNWPTPRGTQTFWLTRGWNKDADRGRSKPNVFNAMHGYIIMRKTQEPRRRDRIDADFADRVIREQTKKMNLNGEKKLLNDNLGPNGFIGFLENMAYDEMVPDRIQHQEYYDLAMVAKIMLEERLEEIERELNPSSRERQVEGGGTSIFSVYSGNANDENYEESYDDDNNDDYEEEDDSQSFNPFG